MIVRDVGRKHLPPKRVLLVGAGAVGQYYGAMLQRGGAHVSFLVRKRYENEVKSGLMLYRIDGKRGRHSEAFQPDAVFSCAEDLEQEHFDQVWLCVSTPAVQVSISDERSELGKLLRNLRGATLVVLQNGLQISRAIRKLVPPETICDGGIAIVAYQAPIVDGEVPSPGIAYYAPVPSPFTGRDAETIAQLLRQGGAKAEVIDDTKAQMAFSSATLMPTITALEGAGWQVAHLRRGDWAKLIAKASEEARRVVSASLDTAPPTIAGFFQPFTVKALSVIAPLVAPFDLDVYLKYHFLKVHDQTRLLIDQFLEDASTYGLPSEALLTLRQRVFG